MSVACGNCLVTPTGIAEADQKHTQVHCKPFKEGPVPRRIARDKSGLHSELHVVVMESDRFACDVMSTITIAATVIDWINRCVLSLKGIKNLLPVEIALSKI